MECILNLWKVLDKYFVIYISANAALYYKLYSFWNNVGYLVLLDIIMLIQIVRFIV